MASRKTKRKPARRGVLRRLARALRWPALLGLAAFMFYMALLDRQITTAFEGRRWDVPARVFAQPIDVYAGRALSRDDFIEHLDDLGYRQRDVLGAEGEYVVHGARLALRTRAFTFWDGQQPSRQTEIRFQQGRVTALRAAGEDLPLLRLDPLMIGALLPDSQEDRIVVAPAEVPTRLREALVAVEDRKFYRHHGIDLRAIARAAWVNLRSGRIRQGGSTITQQLVKNYFLTNQQTFRRKIPELFMAVLLDARYDKRALLNGYINEVFLGQDGARAVHGFALGSQFYFGVPLGELDDAQLATLVGVIRGPSYYDPRRHPERALARRDDVLDILAAEGVLDTQAVAVAKARPLGVVERPGRVRGASPAFMDEVRAQLRRDYAPSDLNTVGLRVFTTLDPFVQARAERLCAEQLSHVERDTGREPDSLQVAAVISDPQSGELLAAVGGREPGFAGFNRAVAMRRPIGSLAKPFVFLAALSSGRYDLSTVVSNDPLEVTLANGDVWAPRNYSDTELGDLPIYRALAESINRPAVHVGLDVGIDAVARQFESALPGVEVPRYAAITLGALNLSPRQVAEAYTTLATGGYATPMRAVREVIDARGQPLKHYDLRVQTSADAAAVVQIVGGMQAVMQHGTGRGAGAIVPADLAVAGKSGTTNDYRDAWFAGFSSDRLAVVWVGRDDNAQMGLSGARAALPIWAQLMRASAEVPYQLPHSDEIHMQTLEYASGMLADASCSQTVLLPLPRSAELPPAAPCAEPVDGREDRRLRDGLLPWLRDRIGRP